MSKPRLKSISTKNISIPNTPAIEKLPTQKAQQIFLWLWVGQLISNIGTQTSLYGIGLWFFTNTQRLADFALVALVVQLARILALPLLANQLAAFPRKKIMLVANGIGAICTLFLALILLRHDSIPFLLPLLLIQAVAAMAEAILVLSFSTLIPLLIEDGPTLIQANGLFATTDGLILAMAPFIGTWLAGWLGLRGVLAIDAASFFLALICVLAAPWSNQFSFISQSRSRWVKANPLTFWTELKKFWLTMPMARVALVIGTTVAFSYAATEVLFPAWVALTYGTERMAKVLLFGVIGYGLGYLAWSQGVGHRWQRYWRTAIVVQALILMGAGLQFFADKTEIWFAGVVVFTAALPVVMASLQQLWVKLSPAKDLPRLFALRYSFEWSARLIAFLIISLAVDKLLKPALAATYWPTWLVTALGVDQGREIAIALGAIGWVLILSLASQRKNLAFNRRSEILT